MNDELRSALDRAAGEDPQVDLAETVWSQGRVVRRRRHVAQGVGGVAAAAVLVGAFALGGGVLDQPTSYDGPARSTVEDETGRTAAVQTYALPTPTPTTEETAEESDVEPEATQTIATGTADAAGPEAAP